MVQNERLLHRIPAPFLPQGLVKAVNKHEKLILYGIIGGFAVMVDVGIFWLITATSDISVLIANFISTSIAVVYSFLTNAFFNFHTTTGLLRRFALFAFVAFVGFLASTLMLWLLVDVAGWNDVLVKALTLPVVFIIQFMLNTRFTFKVEKNHEDRALESVM